MTMNDIDAAYAKAIAEADAIAKPIYEASDKAFDEVRLASAAKAAAYREAFHVRAAAIVAEASKHVTMIHNKEAL